LPPSLATAAFRVVCVEIARTARWRGPCEELASVFLEGVVDVVGIVSGVFFRSMITHAKAS